MFEARTHIQCLDNLYFGKTSEDERECDLTVGKVYFPVETSNGHVYIVNDANKLSWYRDWRFKEVSPKKNHIRPDYKIRVFNPYKR